jgi:hypothetical protein
VFLVALTQTCHAILCCLLAARITGPQQRLVFENDVADFAKKIAERAVVKRKEQLGTAGQVGPDLPTIRDGDSEYQVLSKGERMGPGGLVTLEVLETLPSAMKEAFMTQDIPALHKAVASMTAEDAQHHMDRCRKSGLWVEPDSDGADASREEAAE